MKIPSPPRHLACVALIVLVTILAHSSGDVAQVMNLIGFSGWD